ncbi:MAG: hypothetical protein ACWGMZ_13130 [Thermoguttaceae bacterium]
MTTEIFSQTIDCNERHDAGLLSFLERENAEGGKQKAEGRTQDEFGLLPCALWLVFPNL